MKGRADRPSSPGVGLEGRRYDVLKVDRRRLVKENVVRMFVFGLRIGLEGRRWLVGRGFGEHPYGDIKDQFHDFTMKISIKMLTGSVKHNRRTPNPRVLMMQAVRRVAVPLGLG